mmetsp:Transcript_80617/g.202816  ORF Transcript_80617/g.202816 Transcript_80617/m.202816 type:complete len:312 (+) Transcript_80617:1049-1984(+)
MPLLRCIQRHRPAGLVVLAKGGATGRGFARAFSVASGPRLGRGGGHFGQHPTGSEPHGADPGARRAVGDDHDTHGNAHSHIDEHSDELLDGDDDAGADDYDSAAPSDDGGHRHASADHHSNDDRARTYDNACTDNDDDSAGGAGDLCGAYGGPRGRYRALHGAFGRGRESSRNWQVRVHRREHVHRYTRPRRDASGRALLEPGQGGHLPHAHHELWQVDHAQRSHKRRARGSRHRAGLPAGGGLLRPPARHHQVSQQLGQHRLARQDGSLRRGSVHGLGCACRCRADGVQDGRCAKQIEPGVGLLVRVAAC